LGWAQALSAAAVATAGAAIVPRFFSAVTPDPGDAGEAEVESAGTGTITTTPPQQRVQLAQWDYQHPGQRIDQRI
jgi:hypothetical protein